MKSTLRALLTAAVLGGLITPATPLLAKPDPGFEARDAYYSGEVDKAYFMALEAGERWVAGLAAYRLQNYQAAFDLFTQVALDPAEGDVWLKSGAAFWAARAAAANGQADAESFWLRSAAATPWTFYGLVAEAKLGIAPRAVFAATVLPPDVRLAEAADPLAALIRVSTAPVASALDQFAAMAPISDVAGFNPSAYPAPDLSPLGGFTVDPALVYAIVRQESRFNAAARSPAGARGMMQLMPATAAEVAGDPNLRRRNGQAQLNNAELNLKLGQDYVNQLANALVGDDLFRVIAAYNGGPGAVTKTIDRVGWDADPFLFIESLPARETRDYVEKVMANYWLYRRQFGQDTPSLTALAAGEKRISLTYDRLYTPAPSGPGVQPVMLTNARL